MKRWRVVLDVTVKEIYILEAETADEAVDRIEKEGLDPTRTDCYEAELSSVEEEA